MGNQRHRHWIAAALGTANTLELARDQHGSRVIESTLEFCETSDKETIAGTLLADPDQLISLATDPMGRHVVKTLLRTSGEWRSHRHSCPCCLGARLAKPNHDLYF